jgi:hypothetical protein
MSDDAETDDDLGWPDAYDADASDAALAADIQAELTELRGICMRFARRLDVKAETSQGQEQLAQLNNAAVKAARAVRQVAVLQLEIAGLRDRPGSRPAAGAPANQNKPKPTVHKFGPKPCDYPWKHGDYTEYDDYTDWERETALDAKISAGIQAISDAAREDLAAYGRSDVCREAPRSFAEMVRAIPHPALDAALNDLEPIYAQLLFGKENVVLSLRPASPEVWTEYDAKQKLYGRDRQDSS